MVPRKVAFRVDASIEIASGHVMRCLALASTLVKNGSQCSFICREHSLNMIKMIQDCGHFVFTLPKYQNDIHIGQQNDLEHGFWLGCDWKIDADQTVEVLQNLMPDWLIVDHYAIDIRWESVVSSFCSKILVIDDLADRKHKCSLLLDQNLGKSAVDYLGFLPEKTKVIAGPEYSLLRSEFSIFREASLMRRAHSEVKKIMITLGGIDRQNTSGHILRVLQNCNLSSDTELVIVLGANAPWISEVRKQALQSKFPATVKVNVSNMAELMCDSDLAIGAGGGTSWERCAMGLPTLLVVLADNQRSSALALSQIGAALCIGTTDELDETLPIAIERSLKQENLKLMSVRAANVTDGLGCERVIEAMG